MRLCERHVKAVEALLRGASTSEVAALVGIHERTVRKWRSEPAFAALLEEGQRELVEGLGRRLRSLGARAAATLDHVMGDPSAAPSARVSAAGRVLDAIFRLDELARLEQIEARLTRLEERERDRGRQREEEAWVWRGCNGG